MKHTKIVATISDIKCDVDFIKSLYDAGINVVRMNTAHASKEGIEELINNVRTVSDKIALLMDTKGPEIRTSNCETFDMVTGQKIKMKGGPNETTTPECLYVSYEDILKDVTVGDLVLIDDGELEFKIVEKADDHVVLEAQNNGEIKKRKSVNLPGVRINLPSLTQKDITNIGYAIDHDIDFIAHSFVRNAQDVLDIQKMLDARGSDIKIIAKIENQEGVENIDEILDHAYGVMVARGDLGIEVPQEKIPGIQRELIRKCVKAKKPVIVATQMLHSMIKNPRPTRAEVTDIANAIYYRTDALMLSGETAYGDYPLEAVKTMASIAEEAEKTKLLENDIRIPTKDDDRDITAFLAKQAVRSALKVDVKAIITDSFTGNTARNLAAFRGRIPVYAQCYKTKTMRELALSYGVFASYAPESNDQRQYLNDSVIALKEQNKLADEDIIAYISGKMGTSVQGASSLEIHDVKSFID